MALGVTAATLIYLTRALSRSWTAFKGVIADPDVLIAAGLLSIAYGACLFILFGSWFLTLRRGAPGAVPAARGAFIYCVANAAKYLPGGIFHFAGRQVLGARAGWRHGAIAQATLLEITAIVTAILLLLALTAASSPSVIGSLLPEAWRPAAAYGRLLGFVGLALAYLVFFVSAPLGIFERLFGAPPSAVARTVSMCMAFFAIYAALAMMFAQCLPIERNGPPLPAIGAAYLIAWLGGFIVPGAPGGLGVREVALLVVLGGHDGGNATFALAVGAGMRLVSISGDVIAIAVAWALYRLADRGHTARRRSTEWT